MQYARNRGDVFARGPSDLHAGGVQERCPELPLQRADRLPPIPFDNALTAGARNLMLWTDFTGVDPETAGGGLGNVQDEFQITPPLRTMTLRFNVGF